MCVRLWCGVTGCAASCSWAAAGSPASQSLCNAPFVRDTTVTDYRTCRNRMPGLPFGCIPGCLATVSARCVAAPVKKNCRGTASSMHGQRAPRPKCCCKPLLHCQFHCAWRCHTLSQGGHIQAHHMRAMQTTKAFNYTSQLLTLSCGATAPPDCCGGSAERHSSRSRARRVARALAPNMRRNLLPWTTGADTQTQPAERSRAPTARHSTSGRWGCGWASASAPAPPTRTTPVARLACSALRALTGMQGLQHRFQRGAIYVSLRLHSQLAPFCPQARRRSASDHSSHAAQAIGCRATGMIRGAIQAHPRRTRAPWCARRSATGARRPARRRVGAAGGAAGRRWGTRRTCRACAWAGAC